MVMLGFLGKFLSMIARILMVRAIGTEGMGLYSLATPTMLLLITIAQLGLPTAVATSVAKRPLDGKKIFFSGLIIASLISIIMVVLIYFLSPFLANEVLKNKMLLPTLYGLGFLIPLVSLSALIKGYFIGQNEMRLTGFSTVMEEIGRILFIIIFLEAFTAYGPEYASLGAVIGVAVGEIFQSGYMILFNNRKLYRRIKEFSRVNIPSHEKEIKSILKLSVPLTLARLVGSITFFFEPIIMSNILLHMNVSAGDIALNYGILSGYVMPLILMPGFFAVAFSNYLLPNMSRQIARNEYKKAKKTFFNILGLSFSIGLLMSIVLFFFASPLMKLLYGSDTGKDLVRWLAFPFLVYYVEAPIASALHALNLTNQAFRSTLIACIIRIILLTLLTKYLQVSAVAAATLVSVYVVVFIDLFHVLRAFSAHNVKSIVHRKG